MVWGWRGEFTNSEESKVSQAAGSPDHGVVVHCDYQSVVITPCEGAP